MSGKEELDQEIPLLPEIEEWGKCADMRYDDQTSEDITHPDFSPRNVKNLSGIQTLLFGALQSSTIQG